MAGGEMKVGKQNLPPSEHGDFLRLRLLDLHHHFTSRKKFLGRVDEPGPGLHVDAVRKTTADARLALDQHLVAVFGEQMHAHGTDRHAVFV